MKIRRNLLQQVISFPMDNLENRRKCQDLLDVFFEKVLLPYFCNYYYTFYMALYYSKYTKILILTG